MPASNQYLNTLYCDLFSNSPQKVSIDIPSDMGIGRITQTTTKQGVILSEWQMNYYADTNVQGLNSHEYIQMIFCLSQGVSWEIANEHHVVSIKQGESCIYHGHGKTEYVCYAGQREFLFKSLRIPVPYFRKILQDYFESSEIDAYEKKLLNDLSKVKITPYMEHIFAEVKDFGQYKGGLGYLFLESKIWELLSVYLSEVLELSILPSSELYISRTDRDSILEAKQIIDAQLAFAPTCQVLARQVSLSTSKLTKGFSAMFGKPIHSYIIDQRLEKAAGLLLESDLNVSQISILVGYSKPSNFAAAFKKKYGVIPKYYKDSKPVR